MSNRLSPDLWKLKRIVGTVVDADTLDISENQTCFQSGTDFVTLSAFCQPDFSDMVYSIKIEKHYLNGDDAESAEYKGLKFSQAYLAVIDLLSTGDFKHAPFIRGSMDFDLASYLRCTLPDFIVEKNPSGSIIVSKSFTHFTILKKEGFFEVWQDHDWPMKRRFMSKWESAKDAADAVIAALSAIQ